MANKTTLNSSQALLIEEHISALFQLTRAIRKYADFSKEKLPISPLQIHALFFIKENDGTTMTNLSDCFGVALPTTTKLIEKLVSLKYVQRNPDKKDRRIIHLSLTLNGTQILKKFMEHMHQPLKNLLASLPEEDLAQLHRITNELLLKVEQLKP